MIAFTRGYATSDGQVWSTLEAAQKKELAIIFGDYESAGHSPEDSIATADFILSHKDKIVDVLTLKPTSHPKGRAIAGATRNRKPKVTNEQPKETPTPKPGN